jgi:hypothetical protein
MEPEKLIHKLMSYNSSLPLFEDNQLFKPSSEEDNKDRPISIEEILDAFENRFISAPTPSPSEPTWYTTYEYMRKLKRIPEEELRKLYRKVILKESIKEDNQLFKPASEDDHKERRELELKKLGRDWPIGCQVRVKQATDINHDEWAGTVVKIGNNRGLEPLLVEFKDEHSSPIELENDRELPEYEYYAPEELERI